MGRRIVARGRQPSREVPDGVRNGRPVKRKAPDGVATTDLVLSAHVSGNAEVFPTILDLHVPKGSVVADVTYGTGIFWRNVPKGDYRLTTSDLKSGVDCTKLPYEDETIDCVV